MANIFDIAVILIILLTTLTCCLKGFVRSVFGVAGTVAAFIVALVVGFAANEAVYNAYFKDSTREMAQRTVEQVDTGAIIEGVLRDNGITGDIDSAELNKAIAAEGDMSRNVEKYLDKKGVKNDKDVDKIIDNYVKHPNISDETLEKYHIDRETLNNILSESGEHLKQLLKAAAEEDKSKAAVYLEENIFAPIVMRLVRCILIVLVFVLLKIVISIIIMATGVIRRFDMIRKTDMLLGAVLGFCSGAVTVVLYAYICTVFIRITNGGISPITADMVDSTAIFKIFYDLFR